MAHLGESRGRFLEKKALAWLTSRKEGEWHIHCYSRLATAQKYLLNRNLGWAILTRAKNPLENP